MDDGEVGADVDCGSAACGAAKSSATPAGTTLLVVLTTIQGRSESDQDERANNQGLRIKSWQ